MEELIVSVYAHIVLPSSFLYFHTFKNIPALNVSLGAIAFEFTPDFHFAPPPHSQFKPPNKCL